MTQKGELLPGKDADILLWDPAAVYTISAETQRMNTDYNMFQDWVVRGNATKVFSRGDLVVDKGAWIGDGGRGRFIPRTANAGGLQ